MTDFGAKAQILERQIREAEKALARAKRTQDASGTSGVEL